MASNLTPYRFVWALDEAYDTLVYVWADAAAQLTFAIADNRTGFDPSKGIPLTVKDIASTKTTVLPSLIPCYGFPTKLTWAGNVLWLEYANLSSTVEDPAKQVPGDILRGQWQLNTDGTSSTPNIVWESLVQAQNAFTLTTLPVLDVCDDPGVNPTVPPAGVVAVEYERDALGNVVIDPATNVPKIAKVDGSKAASLANAKIGRVAMSFAEDYFGTGIHAWLGAGTNTEFQIFHLASDVPFNTVRARRGTLFTASGLFFDIFNPYSAPITVTDGQYVWLQMNDENSDSPTFSLGSGSSVNEPARPSILRYPLARIAVSGSSMKITPIRPLQFNQANMKLALRGAVSLKVGDVEYTDGKNSLYGRWQ